MVTRESVVEAGRRSLNGEEPRSPRLSVQNASKTFGVTTVLRGVSLDIMPGQVHAVIGENGSGKSTLIKLLSGFHDPDRGSAFLIDGTKFGPPVRPWGWQHSRLAFVHQDLGLVHGLSVLDNVRLGRYERARVTRRIKMRSERQTVARALAGVGCAVDPGRLVSSLNFTERASVAIARAIQSVDVARACIVFDESTRSLPPDSLDDFYGLVRRLVELGSSVLFVSHRLDEVLELADRVTVLRDGRRVAEADITPATTEAELAALLVHHDATRPRRHSLARATDDEQATLLDARGVCGVALAPLTFALRSGEVLGVTGTIESGYAELPYLLGGVRAGGGRVSVGNCSFDLIGMRVHDAIAAGVRLVPEDRGVQGLALTNSVRENLTLSVVGERPRSYYISRRAERRDFADTVRSFQLRPPRPEIPAGQLSGGNQQKLLLAKSLLGRPKVLVVHEPTQGVDVGARQDLLGALRAAAGQGVGVLVCSMEASDLAAVCDRVLVVRRGLATLELLDPTADAILEATYPGRGSSERGGTDDLGD